MSNSSPIYDYRAKSTPRRGYIPLPDEPSIELVVRPGRVYGEAPGGCHVLIDASEYERGPTRETLYSIAEHEAAMQRTAQIKQRHVEAAAPKPVVDSITQGLRRLWNGGVDPEPQPAPAAASSEGGSDVG